MKAKGKTVRKFMFADFSIKMHKLMHKDKKTQAIKEKKFLNGIDTGNVKVTYKVDDKLESEVLYNDRDALFAKVYKSSGELKKEIIFINR